MSEPLFLSTVTKEFGELRKRLAHFLQRTKKVHVRHQDDFFHHGVKTLHMLEEEIIRSKFVVHIIGGEPGWVPPVDQVEAFLTRHPRFAGKFPEVTAVARTGAVSATQWEAWLALFFGKRLYGYELPKRLLSGSSQQLHSDRLHSTHDHPKAVEDENALFEEVIGSLIECGLLTKAETESVMFSADESVAIPARLRAETDDSPEPELPAAAGQLSDLMSDLSESGWHAKWLMGLEYDIWHAIQRGPGNYGQTSITDRHIAALKALSRQCKGWVQYGEEGLRWVPLDVWEKHYSNPEQNPLPEGKTWPHPDSGKGREIIALTSLAELSGSLKREALLFDKIAITDLSYYMEDSEPQPSPNPLLTDLYTMVEHGLAIPSVPTRSTFYKKGDAEDELARLIDKTKWDSLEHKVMFARLTAMQMRRIQGVEALPLFGWPKSIQSANASKRQAVLRLALNKLPVPDQTVSWDQILAYKEDLDSRRRFAGLRDWVNGVCRSELSPAEIADKIEWLMSQCDAHLKVHRVGYQPGLFEFVITTTAEIAEYLVRFQWRRAAQSLFTIKEASNLDSLKAELTAPGSQIAYISHTKRKFGKR